MGATLHTLVRQGRAFSGNEKNCSFLNLGDGNFADISAVCGFDFPDDGRAIAQCDWDADGDVDLWVANRNGPQVRFLRNDLQSGNHFLSLRLEGKDCNRDAIGARVEVVLQDESNSRLIKTLRAGEGFLAQSSKWVHFGLGSSGTEVDVSVTWPGGEKESFGLVAADGRYLLVQHAGQAQPVSSPAQGQDLKPETLRKRKTESVARIHSAAKMPMPAVKYETFEGQKRLLDFHNSGKPILINLWASWCRACLVELKEFAEHSQEIEDSGLEMWALSVDRLDLEKGDESNVAPGQLQGLGFAGKAGWATENTTEILRLIREHLFDTHQPMPLPTSMLIDAKGRVSTIYYGPVRVEQLLEDVALLEESLRAETMPFPGRWRTTPRGMSPLDLVWQMVESGYQAQAIDYVQHHRPLIENQYKAPKLFVLIGNNELSRGNAENAVRYYKDALALDVDYDEALNNLAWVLATNPDEKLRDGKEAVRLASAAVSQKRGNTISMLATLSVAYAEDGQFEQAVQVAEEAQELARAQGHQALVKELEKRIRGFKEGRPHRSP